MASDLWLYFLAVLAVILLPGMDMAYVLASSLSGGRRGAVAAVAGIASGGAVHVLAGATGIAALVTLFPSLYHWLLAAGTAYLVWIGWNIYRSAGAPPAEVSSGFDAATTYRRGVTTCLLNPKAYAFTFAIFPAFIRADSGELLARTAALAAITVATQVVVYGAVAALAVRSRAFFTARQSTLARTMGAMLIGAALVTATQAWSADAKTLVINTGTIMNDIAAAQRKSDLDAGRAGFDFEIGDWVVENRRMVKPLEADSPWETFRSTVHMEKLPGGIGNFDTFVAPEWRPGWMGMALRSFNGETGLWSIYLLDSKTGGLDRVTGHLAVLVVGKFDRGIGIFEDEEIYGGVPIRCRFTWDKTDPEHPKWQQDFSYDGGKTWVPNWYMTYARLRK
ncbi:MAG: LysE family translocator [Betaproteobacteria bacterium]|nr:LysE family translocator [Betaproteobacteria bacterium]